MAPDSRSSAIGTDSGQRHCRVRWLKALLLLARLEGSLLARLALFLPAYKTCTCRRRSARYRASPQAVPLLTVPHGALSGSHRGHPSPAARRQQRQRPGAGLRRPRTPHHRTAGGLLPRRHPLLPTQHPYDLRGGLRPGSAGFYRRLQGCLRSRYAQPGDRPGPCAVRGGIRR